MSKKGCLLLSILLISSVLFFPLSTAGRVLLQAEAPGQEERHESGNDRSKMGIKGSYSNPAHSATGQSSPAQATPNSATGQSSSAGASTRLGLYHRHCIIQDYRYGSSECAGSVYSPDPKHHYGRSQQLGP